MVEGRKGGREGRKGGQFGFESIALWGRKRKREREKEWTIEGEKDGKREKGGKKKSKRGEGKGREDLSLCHIIFELPFYFSALLHHSILITIYISLWSLFKYVYVVIHNYINYIQYMA